MELTNYKIIVYGVVWHRINAPWHDIYATHHGIVSPSHHLHMGVTLGGLCFVGIFVQVVKPLAGLFR